MTTVTHPLHVALEIPQAGKPERPRPAPGSWRYATPKNSRARTLAAVLISAAIHGAIFFGLPHRAPVKIQREKDNSPPMIALVMPKLQELDEPEPVAKEDTPPPELGAMAPMQADVPQVPKPGDFVQQLDFSSLLPRPDLGDVKMFTIPEHINRTGKGPGGFGKIFDLSDLDRVPEPVFQPAPAYPPTLRREGLKVKVIVDFIVDVDGRVVNPVIFDSEHSAFNDPAILGVAKWKFRAGVRAGTKVNTRMRVPIIFTVVDAFDRL